MPDEMMDRPNGRRNFTPDQRDAALLAVIMSGGRVKQTARELDVNYETLRSMVDRNHERYEELQRKHGPELEARAVANLQAFVARAEEAKFIALDASVAQIEAGESKSPANDLKNIAVAQGISVQKILELSGRPTQIVQHGGLAEAMARLRQLGATVEANYDVTSDATMLPSPVELPAGEAIDDNAAGLKVPAEEK